MYVVVPRSSEPTPSLVLAAIPGLEKKREDVDGWQQSTTREERGYQQPQRRRGDCGGVVDLGRLCSRFGTFGEREKYIELGRDTNVWMA